MSTASTPLPSQGDTLQAVISEKAEMEAKAGKAGVHGAVPVAQPEDSDENTNTQNNTTSTKSKIDAAMKDFAAKAPKINDITNKELVQLKVELKESADELYSESYAPKWLWTLIPMPFMAIPLYKYHVHLTSCELKFGFTTSMTSMTIPVEEILHVKKVLVSPTMFYGYGVRHNGHCWGYIGSGGEEPFGIRIVVKNQTKRTWSKYLKTAGYMSAESAEAPQMIFFTCKDADKFMTNFEIVQKEQKDMVDAL